MSVVNSYKVHFHFEAGGKKISPEQVEYVQAAANDFNSLRAVLSSNNKLQGSGSLQITSVINVGPSGMLA